MAASVQLKNGVNIPSIGLGTWLTRSKAGGEAVREAIDLGYRLIDTAYAYLNEKDIGDVLSPIFASKKLAREDLVVSTKLWNTFHPAELVSKGLKSSLESLQLDYIDLYYLHWPISYKEGDDPFPPDPVTNLAFSTADYLDTWREMERALEKGLVRSIGISNFNHKQIERLEQIASVQPMMIQIEVHPYLTNEKLIKFALDRGIQVTAYSPFGAPLRPWATEKDPRVLEDPTITSIASSHQRTPAQVVLRWCVQRGICAVPKSTQKEHMADNLKIFDFALSESEMAAISGLNKNLRGLHEEWAGTHPHYPFHEEY